MAITIGNHSIDEIIYAVAQNFDDEMLYVLDQLSSASIEISAESTDVTDKNGNVVRTLYTSKTGTFNSTNAFLHPAAMNAGSGSKIVTASASAVIEMPKMVTIAAGVALDIEGAKEGTIHAQGIYGNGANAEAMTDAEVLAAITGTITDGKYAAGAKFTAPAAATDAPTMYVVLYQRDVTEGIKLQNTATESPDTEHLTLYCSYVDPCDDQLKACYVYIPSFMPDPNMTINLDRESQELDFNGTLQMDYCGTEKLLYVIYYPNENAVKTVVTA